MDSAGFLLFVRGPGLQIATAILVFGIVVRLLEIFLLGKKENLAAHRTSGAAQGFRTMLSRSLPIDKNTAKRSMFTIISGYLFHLGLFVVIFLLAPHISLFKSMLGFAWPSVPTPLVDFIAVLTMITLLAVLFRRVSHPVLKHLSTGHDYTVWLLTFLPVLTGYMAYHHLLLSYNWMLGIHILSVEVMLICLPFTKLTHAFSLFIARWYTGVLAGEKGVPS